MAGLTCADSPDHTVDYLVGGYNLFEGDIGKAYICKVPAERYMNYYPNTAAMLTELLASWEKIPAITSKEEVANSH